MGIWARQKMFEGGGDAAHGALRDSFRAPRTAPKTDTYHGMGEPQLIRELARSPAVVMSELRARALDDPARRPIVKSVLGQYARVGRNRLARRAGRVVEEIMAVDMLEILGGREGGLASP